MADRLHNYARKRVKLLKTSFYDNKDKNDYDVSLTKGKYIDMRKQKLFYETEKYVVWENKSYLTRGGGGGEYWYMKTK